jgi:hypothetical protein
LLQTQDASQEGYGAVAYLRIENKQDEVKYIMFVCHGEISPCANQVSDNSSHGTILCGHGS